MIDRFFNAIKLYIKKPALLKDAGFLFVYLLRFIQIEHLQ